MDILIDLKCLRSRPFNLVKSRAMKLKLFRGKIKERKTDARCRCIRARFANGESAEENSVARVNVEKAIDLTSVHSHSTKLFDIAYIERWQKYDEQSDNVKKPITFGVIYRT
ncbi:hypothetical protein V1478_006827 [Vespula squamosa]|uniref:Uncharacterized protein n=1 Tax=Vespula squamosa TaxID=30214 RepID=A0ABD2B104_VESSQ